MRYLRRGLSICLLFGAFQTFGAQAVSAQQGAFYSVVGKKTFQQHQKEAEARTGKVIENQEQAEEYYELLDDVVSADSFDEAAKTLYDHFAECIDQFQILGADQVGDVIMQIIGVATGLAEFCDDPLDMFYEAQKENCPGEWRGRPISYFNAQTTAPGQAIQTWKMVPKSAKVGRSVQSCGSDVKLYMRDVGDDIWYGAGRCWIRHKVTFADSDTITCGDSRFPNPLATESIQLMANDLNQELECRWHFSESSKTVDSCGNRNGGSGGGGVCGHVRGRPVC